jgi:hypothetical protein
MAMKLRTILAGTLMGLTVITPFAVIGMSEATAGATAPSVMVQGETPRTSPSGGGYDPYWYLAKGTSVTMLCWTGGPYVDNSGKWFRIKSNAYPYQGGGYVPANSVGHQAIVGHC